MISIKGKNNTILKFRSTIIFAFKLCTVWLFLSALYTSINKTHLFFIVCGYKMIYRQICTLIFLHFRRHSVTDIEELIPKETCGYCLLENFYTTLRPWLYFMIGTKILKGITSVIQKIFNGTDESCPSII